jgi:molecular chaperone IbpA
MYMTTFDFSPLFRSTIGFDRLQKLMDAALEMDQATTGYPPYNIETTGDDAYRITMAVAGFGADDLSVEARENTLTVSGQKKQENGDGKLYLHRGIASREFVRRFQLADHVRVAGANLGNGLLTIDLVREVPEELKPRRIEIAAGAPESLVAKAKKLIEGGKKAA